MAKARKITDKLGAQVAKATNAVAPASEGVAGPSPNPATNLLLHDLALRSAGRIIRLGFEKGLVGRRYGTEFAKDAINNRSVLQNAAAYGATRLATRSLPGAVLIWGGMLAKTLYDRRKGKRAALREGEKSLARQADPDSLL